MVTFSTSTPSQSSFSTDHLVQTLAKVAVATAGWQRAASSPSRGTKADMSHLTSWVGFNLPGKTCQIGERHPLFRWEKSQMFQSPPNRSKSMIVFVGSSIKEFWITSDCHIFLETGPWTSEAFVLFMFQPKKELDLRNKSPVASSSLPEMLSHQLNLLSPVTPSCSWPGFQPDQRGK